MSLPTQSHSPIAYFTRSLVANQPSVIDVTGSRVWVRSCKVVFQLKLDQQSFFPMVEGFGLALEKPDFFKSLTLQSTIAQTVNLFVGNAQVFSAGTILLRESVTQAGGEGPLTIPAGGDIGPYVYAAAGYGNVKQVIITNDSAVRVRLDVVDLSSNIVPAAIIPANSSFKVDNQIAFYLHNLGASAATVYIAVFYYA